ncbi:MAG: cell wall-binding repeat-containing protein [Peptococcaceae bacterium]|nr:cell wall-binding repeat-containing protein [Peptococcaceae bacterium]
MDFHPALVASPLASKKKAVIRLVDKVPYSRLVEIYQQKGYVVGEITD